MKMKQIVNERGIALVMVLVLSLIGLGMVSALLFMLTQGTQFSGAQKFYRSAEEAALGGVEITTQYLAGRGVLEIPLLSGLAFTAGCNCNDPYVYTDNIDLMTGAASNRCDKLCNPTSSWPAAADEHGNPGIQVSLNPKVNADIPSIILPGIALPGVDPISYTIYSKVVDTVQGNSDVGGLVMSGELGGAGVVASNSGLVNPPHNPYIYRLQVQAERSNNPRERSRMSVLYLY